MSNAAIAFYPDSFDTSVDKLMGRQSAGESFLRGFIRHGQTDELYFVADGTGGAAFASTLEEHERNVARWRAVEKSRPSPAASAAPAGLRPSLGKAH